MEEQVGASDLRIRFGKRLAVIRKIRGVSQEKFAADSGLARSHVSGIERGKINVSLSTIETIAVALDVEPIDLFDFGSDVISVPLASKKDSKNTNGKNKQTGNVNT